MSAPRRVLPSLFLAFLLGASILAVQPGQALPVSTGQATAVENAFGDGAPPGGWQFRTETHTFYVTSSPTAPIAVEPPGNVGPQAPPADLGLTMDRPATELGDDTPTTQADATALALPGDNTILFNGVDGLVIPMTPNVQPVDSLTIYDIAATVYAACDTSGINPTGQIGTSLDEAFASIELVVRKQETADNGATWQNVGNPIADILMTPEAGGSGPLVIQPYSGIAHPGKAATDSGPVLLPGVNRLQLELYPVLVTDIFATGVPVPGLTCYLHYGTEEFDSQMRIVDNAARLSAFTTDADGNLATGFAHGGNTDSSNRRFVVQTLQANAWGNSAAQVQTYETNVRLRDTSTGEFLYYVEDFNDAEPRERDIRVGGLQCPDVSRCLNLVSRSSILLTPTIVSQAFTFSYPVEFEDATMQVEFYAEDQLWDLRGGVLQVGGRGVAFTLAEGEQATHLINPGEPTEFSFRVNNTGTEDDTITVVATDPGGGWTARVLGGGVFFVRAGGHAVGRVELVPPPSASAGDSRSLVLSASSSFVDVPDPSALTVRATVTNEVIRSVAIDTITDRFQIHPGQTKSFPATVANRGTARDSFVVLPSFPGNIQGWTVVTKPSSLQIVAGGLETLQVSITAPPTASSATTFPLGLTAVAVGDATTTARHDVTVTVIKAEGVLLGLYDAATNRTLRADSSPACVDSLTLCIDDGTPAQTGQAIADSDFDQGSLFRVPVTNIGDLPATYKVEAFWDKIPGTLDNRICDNNQYLYRFLNAPTDGVPDGWRFNYMQGVPAEDIPPVGTPPSDGGNSPRGERTYGGFSGYYQLNSSANNNALVVPAHSTRNLYFELAYLSENFQDVCPANDFADEEGVGVDGVASVDADVRSPIAAMKVRVTNLADPTQTDDIRMVSTVIAPGSFEGTNRYAARKNVVDLEIQEGQLQLVPTLKTGESVFNLTAINRGNDKDDLRIAVTGHPNWSHRIKVLGVVPALSGGCDPPTNGGAVVLCPRRGVYDEVHFQVIAKPGDFVGIGDRDPITVTVFSGESPGVFDSITTLTARAVGDLAFSATTLGATTRSVALGQTVLFPVLIVNEGTGDDSYRFTLTQGSNGWKSVVSSSTPVFVPAGHEAPAYLAVTPGTTVTAGSSGQFTVQVESVANGARRTFQLHADAKAPGTLVLKGVDGADVLLGGRGVPQNVTVEATKLTGAAGDTVTFTIDKDSLPADWTIDDGEPDTDKAIVETLEAGTGGVSKARATFKVTAPSDALGNGRAVLHVDAVTSSALRAATDISLNLASTKGVALELAENETQVIAPGGPAVFNLTVRNLGLGDDNVRFAWSALPTGWSLQLNPASATLGPLQAMDVQAVLTAPTTAKPADIASIVVFASSVQDPVQIASQVLRAQVGFNALAMKAVGDVPSGAPQETVVRIVNVTNTGTLPDEVQIASKIDTTGLNSAAAKLDGGPTLLSLAPGETEQVSAEALFGIGVPSDSTIQWTVTAKSLLDARPLAQRANASLPLVFHVLPYVSSNVNDDSVVEFAVDRNDDASDGFEEFKPSTTPGGSPLETADVARFLRDDARESKMVDVTLANGTTQRVLDYVIDGDGDGKVDHFLDKDSDAQPDYYWDPDANKASPIGFRKDINGDQVPESFVDTDGDGEQDAVFDLTRGEFTDVLKVDVDGDCQLRDSQGNPEKTAAECLDYVIDKNGNGKVDGDETVLYTRSGGLLIVQIVDVDGDGKDDQVFDTDGDGNPDYFIPSGSGESVEISMRDVNGDGTQDWTFDGDGDGRKESYYDPVTGKAHVIDAAGHFVDALKQYWYVGALFALVLVLFVALVLVTRR